MACRILFLRPGIEPSFWQWKRRVLTTGSPGNSLKNILKNVMQSKKAFHMCLSRHITHIKPALEFIIHWWLKWNESFVFSRLQRRIGNTCGSWYLDEKSHCVVWGPDGQCSREHHNPDWNGQSRTWGDVRDGPSEVSWKEDRAPFWCKISCWRLPGAVGRPVPTAHLDTHCCLSLLKKKRKKRKEKEKDQTPVCVWKLKHASVTFQYAAQYIFTYNCVTKGYIFECVYFPLNSISFNTCNNHGTMMEQVLSSPFFRWDPESPVTQQTHGRIRIRIVCWPSFILPCSHSIGH